MQYSGINLEKVKVNNRSAILKILNDAGSNTRKEIAVKLGLTPATVTLLTSELLSEGIIREQGEVAEEKRAGRRKVLIDIVPEHRYVLTLCIEEGETTLALADLKGRPVKLQRIPTNKKSPAAAFLREAAQLMLAMLWEAGVSREQVLGLGVSVPGRVDWEQGISLHAYRIWDEAVPVREILTGCLNLPVLVENNVRAFAMGELIFGNGKVHKDLAVIKWGPGLGSSIIIDHQIYGSHNAPNAEIGHIIVRQNGRLCHCGKKGCLETYVSAQAIEADGGDPTEAISMLAMQLDALVTLLAPEQVILYGSMLEREGYLEKLTEACRSCDPELPALLQLSEQESKKDYIGPLAVAVSELFYKVGGV